MTEPTPEAPETPETPDREREALLEWLVAQRGHVLGVLSGLSEEDLRRPVLPSGWSCLALVRHLAVDDERFWFRAVAAGEPLPLDDDTGWQPSPDEPAEAVLDLYRREIAASDAALAGLSLDAPPAGWPEYFEDWRLQDVREVILHVIAETATHAGHLDAARELLDGRTWMGPDDTRDRPRLTARPARDPQLRARHRALARLADGLAQRLAERADGGLARRARPDAGGEPAVRAAGDALNAGVGTGHGRQQQPGMTEAACPRSASRISNSRSEPA